MIKRKNLITLLAIFVIILVLITYFLIKNHLTCYSKTTSPISNRVAEMIENGAKFDDFITFVRKITLNLPDTLFISTIPSSRDVAIFDSFVIIFDQMNMGVFVFNADGKFLKFYGGKKGSGPGEFLSMDYFFVDRWNKLIYIYDYLNKRFTAHNLITDSFKIIDFKEELMLRHFCVDSLGYIYIHHPPLGKYWGFITIVDPTGKIVKTIHTGADKKFQNYYNRGLLNGDIYLTSTGLILESNIFYPHIFIGNNKLNQFRKSCEIPDYSLELKDDDILKDRNYFYKYPFLESFIVNEEMGLIFQIYIPTKEKKQKKIEHFYLNVFDTSGFFLGQLKLDPSEDIVPISNQGGDPNYIISSEPRLNEKIPFNILLYKWKELEIE